MYIWSNKYPASSLQFRLALLAGGILCGLSWACSGNIQQKTPIKKEVSLQKTVVNYLNLPNFVHDSFPAEVLPSFARLEKYDSKNQFLYFSTLQDDYSPARMSELVLDTSQIEYGKPMGNGYIKLGPAYLYNKDRQLYRFPVEQLRIDSSQIFRRQFDDYVYQLSLQDIREFYTSKNLYNSPALFLTDTSEEQEVRVIANHSAPIAPKGEPSLIHLVNQLIDSTDSQELQTQKLLDFVASAITYESHGGYEIFMKPHEILLSGKTDCSGKVVLYSSLLHQIEVPHLLIYQDEHICVAVQGDFPNENGMQFFHEGIPYQIAETTLPGFDIGISQLNRPALPETFEHIQLPGYTSKLFDPHTGDSLEFAVRYVPVEE